MTRFATVLAALTPGHPLSVHIDPMAVKADFDRNAKAMELNVDQLGLIEFNSQVAQSIDRSLILAGVTKERHAKVSFASQPNMQTWAIAKTLGVRAGLRQACLHDGHQLARLAAAMTETLALAIPELPGLADDKLNQAASSILFQELLSIIETSRPYIPSMSDAEILALTKRAFDAKSAKISRKVKR